VDLPGRGYDILIERGLLSQCGALAAEVLRGKKIALVSDSNVAPLYAEKVIASLQAAGFSVGEIIVPAGEASKCPAQLARLWEEMMAMGLTRRDAVVALGGGVVGDLAGFAAATLLRGVDWIQIPTTLLAQVDSSVGGKVAVDLEAGKNLAGAFHQPRRVIIDPDCLATLTDRVFSDGMAEVIKYGCIFSADFFNLIARCGGREGVMQQIESVVETCCDFKRQVVEEDEQDTGRRMLLNFGHTFGHVYEKAYHYETYTHGEAVAAGMIKALQVGAALGITPAEEETKLRDVLAAYALPQQIAVDAGEYKNTLAHDKKNAGAEIHFVALSSLGGGIIHRMPLEELTALLEERR